MKNIKIKHDNLEISNENKICLIAGPCQLESEQHALDMAGKIKEIAAKLMVSSIKWNYDPSSAKKGSHSLSISDFY